MACIKPCRVIPVNLPNNKEMKKILLTITMALGISVLAQAQTKEQRPHKSPEQRAERVSAMLQKKLSLSADQSAKVKTVLLARGNQLDSIKAINSTDRKAKHQAVKGVLQQTDTQLASIFTASQKETYGQLKAQVMKNRKGHFGDRKFAANRKGFVKDPAQRAERMTGMLQKKLNLSADQSVKVKAIFLARATEVQKLRADTTKRVDRTAMKALHEKTNKELASVLTAQQQETYSQLKAKMKGRHRGHKEVAAPTEG